MNSETRHRISICSIGFLLTVCVGAAGQSAPTNSYTQSNLASDIPGMANTVDSYMVNPWGLIATGGKNAGGYWFISDNGNGFVSLGTPSGSMGEVLYVSSASGQGPGSPAGDCLFPAGFETFVTLDGTIQMNPGSGSLTTMKVNNSAAGAKYTACTLWRTAKNGPETLYVANAAGGVEAYDTNFNPVVLPPGAFIDPNIPAGYTPYGIYAQTGAGKIWVTFYNGIPGIGQGYVDAFDSNGNLLQSLQHGSWMNQPWGIAQAPSAFGAFSNALLVAMTGSGVVAAFNPPSGQFRGVLENSSGQPIVNSGLHGIGFGNGHESGPTTTLYFTAGIDNFAHGLFGSITAN